MTFPLFRRLGPVLLTLLFWVMAAGGAVAQGMGPPGGAPKGPTDVGIITMQQADVPYVRTLPGRAVAFEQGEIRPRVSGVVEEILYAAGAKLAPGDPMFRVEDASYRAAFAAAKAALAGADAEAKTALATVNRYKSLQGNAVSQADVQQAEAAAATAEANLAAAEAALDVAQLDLDRTVIRSPIAGVAGLPTVSVGALVTANQSDALATVTRLDPIYVDVSDSSAGLLRVRNRIEAGSLTPGGTMGVTLVLENETEYARQGSVVVAGNEVSSTTGTFDLRVQFDNPDQMILPGQFLRVNLTLGTTRAWLVPQRATGRRSDGTLTAWVVADGKAKKVDLTTSGSHQNAWVVTGGVADGDQLIVDGLTNLKEGAEVKTVPVTIDADGVVHDAPAGGE